MFFFLALLVLTGLAGQSAAQFPVTSAAGSAVDGFAARTYGNGRETMAYRLFIPQSYNPGTRYPLIVWLHGAGGAGHDNRRQIFGDQMPGTHTWTRPPTQAKYPAFVLVPQSAGGWSTDARGKTLSGPLVMVTEILDTLEKEFSLDSHRIYVAGQSDGGYGVWELITKRPERFAAAIPVSGGGDPAGAARAVQMPIWAFHGDADRVIPVSASRQMIAAVRKAGGQPRYTEYKGAGHDIWARTFAEPDLVAWLFAQHN